jgi:dTDP-4-dehydrorhamnose reductase
VADQFGSPTFPRDLAGTIRDLVRANAREQDVVRFASSPLLRPKQAAQPNAQAIPLFQRRVSIPME